MSFVFWTDDWQPDSYVDKIEANLRNNHHTLCLLDIKVKEQSIENMMKYVQVDLICNRHFRKQITLGIVANMICTEDCVAVLFCVAAVAAVI